MGSSRVLVSVFAGLLLLCAVPVAKAEEAEQQQDGELPTPKFYYWNSVTSANQWERPAEMGIVSQDPDHKGAIYYIDPETQTATWDKPAAYDWQSAEAEDGRTYYFNLKLDKKQWELPAELAWHEEPVPEQKETEM
eukprot:Hpha_TRINITY_DN13266_c0_g1::TRINITY_DN13266_c0_g1_i1::g.155078::m.155078